MNKLKIPKQRLTSNEKALIRRYLVWCYKTTKEDLDRIDRYTTQHLADLFILSELRKGFSKNSGLDQDYLKQVDEFEKYLHQKKANADLKKYLDKSSGKLTPEYNYLQNRCAAIEKAIKHFLGAKELKTINDLYEVEMTERILKAREHS